MKVLITGYKGMLGTDLTGVLSCHEVIGAGRNELDITNTSQVMEHISESKTEVIINCAAYTNVDGCETDKDTAYAVNAAGTKNLAEAAAKYNIPLLHISTDYVFDGQSKTPYLENDNTNPINIYGKSKLEGENFVKKLCQKYFILRTQWLYGFHGKNFVRTMLKLAKEKSEIKVVNDQFGSPTYTVDLAHTIKEIIETDNYGTYHVTNEGIISWYQFTKDIVNIAGLDTKISPCTTKEYPRPATRPAYSPLENRRLKVCGFSPLRNYKEALVEYIQLEMRQENG